MGDYFMWKETSWNGVCTHEHMEFWTHEWTHMVLVSTISYLWLHFGYGSMAVNIFPYLTQCKFHSLCAIPIDHITQLHWRNTWLYGFYRVVARRGPAEGGWRKHKWDASSANGLTELWTFFLTRGQRRPISSVCDLISVMQINILELRIQFPNITYSSCSWTNCDIDMVTFQLFSQYSNCLISTKPISRQWRMVPGKLTF